MQVQPYPRWNPTNYSYHVPTYSDWRWTPRPDVSVQPWAWYYRKNYRYPSKVMGKTTWIQSGGLSAPDSESNSLLQNDVSV